MLYVNVFVAVVSVFGYGCLCLRVFVCFFSVCVFVFVFCVHGCVLFARVKVKQVNKSTNSLIKILSDLLT